MKKQLAPLLIVLVFSILGLKALLHPGLYTAHDIWHQVARLYHYQRAVADGAFPPYWITTLAGGLGYPLFIFSYHFPWLLALPMLKIGFDIPTTIKILFFLSYALSGLAMYCLGQRIFKLRWAGLLSAILYLWAPYRFLTILVSAQMGVAFVYTFVPVLFLGIWLATEKEKEKFALILTALGSAGIILSHFSSVLATIPLTAIFSLVLYHLTKDKKRFLSNLAKGFLLGFGLSAFYLLPAFVFSRAGVLGFGDYFIRHFVNFSQLVYSKWGYGPITHSAKDGELSFQVGIGQWLSVISALAIIAFAKIKKSQKLLAASLVAAFIVSLFMMLDYSLPVWRVITKFVEVDFPFRFMLPAVFAASLLSGLVIANVNKVFIPLIFIFFVLLALYTNRNHTRVNLYTDISVADYVAAEFTTSSMNEYLPKWVDTSVFKLKLSSPLEPEAIPVTNLARDSQKLAFAVNLAKEMPVTLNHFGYPGITLRVDGQKRAYTRDNYGRITTLLSPGKHQISVQFEETSAIKAGKIISLVSLVIFGLLLLQPLRRYFRPSSRIL